MLAASNQGSPLFDAYIFDTTTTGKLDVSITGSTGAGPIAIVAAPGASDKNTILSSLWIFPADAAPDPGPMQDDAEVTFRTTDLSAQDAGGATGELSAAEAQAQVVETLKAEPETPKAPVQPLPPQLMPPSRWPWPMPRAIEITRMKSRFRLF